MDNIIGLSTTECNCFVDGIPIDAGTSESGLMLDRLEGLNLQLISGAADCENSLWVMMDKARNEASSQFQSDFYAELQNKYSLKRKPFRGAIGETRYKNTLTLSGAPAYAGISVCTNKQKGGIMRIKRIGTCFTQTGSFTLTIYNDLQDASIDSVSLSTEANKVKWNTLTNPIDLPLADEGGSYIRYDMLYTVASAPGSPKDNKTSCGCGGYKPSFDLNAKRFRPANNAASNWDMYVMVGSAQGSTVTTGNDRDTFSFGSSYLNGIILDVEFLCDFSDLLCQQVTDFEDNPNAIAVAGAIRYLSGMFLIDYILASSNINYYTMTDRERLMQKKSSYAKEYEYRLKEVITPNVNIDHNDCLVCNNENAPRKVGILS